MLSDILIISLQRFNRFLNNKNDSIIFFYEILNLEDVIDKKV